MKNTTALAARDAALVDLRGIYFTAKILRKTSAEIQASVLDQINAVLTARGAPRWVQSHVDGYERCLIDGLYAYCLVHGGFIDGVFYTSDFEDDRYYRKHGIDAVQFTHNAQRRGHYWKEPLDGKYRPYSVVQS